MLEVSDLQTAKFRSTKAADNECAELTRTIGWPHRYIAARLAIARSLSLPAPPLVEFGGVDMATTIRGIQLFGEGENLAAWLALIVQRSDRRNMSKGEFQALVSAHWTRGAELLAADWKNAGSDMARFVARLAELANLSENAGEGGSRPTPAMASEIHLPVGEIASDARTGEKVSFALNGAGGSPHMAIMGGVGSGKTRTAVHMLKELRHFGETPLLAFDFKGDLAENLAATFGADVPRPPDTPVPLNVLHVSSDSENAIKQAASRVRDAFVSVKMSKIGGVQSEALWEAIATTLRTRIGNRAATLADVAHALGVVYEERDRKPDELTALLNELTRFDLFTPTEAPADFFCRSWIVQLPQDGSEEIRRLIVNLTLNALDRWLNGLPDAPMDAEGRRAVRHVTLLDEAHIILRTRLPALANLVRMSRSKGGVLLLASQSPDDFEGAEDAYLDNMGLTLAFNTQAKPGPTRRIFGDGHSLTGLNVGEALCRIRAEAKTRRVTAWIR
ncbi:MAG: type IV secretion system DNA-binding domain-containing protein [Albidovulum sp.]|nr:type IV secretion system DNA-binding domain-containing protein [Albidovulum sp.]